MFRNCILLLVSFLLASQSANGQLFPWRRPAPQPDCPGGMCPTPPNQNPKPAPNPDGKWYYEIAVPEGYRFDSDDVELMRDWSYRAVRIKNSNACGSGSLCGRDSKYIYILTNAHVATTQLGHVVDCEALILNGDGATEHFDAVVVEAAYSTKTVTDWAVLRADVEHMRGIEPIRLAVERPDANAFTGTWGFPRCGYCKGQFIQTIKFDGAWFWYPNSIPGQSGSAIIQGGKQYGLLTWSTGGRGAGQFTSVIYKQSQGATTAGPDRGNELTERPCLPGTDGLTYCVDDDFLVEGYHREADVSQLPIWEGGTPDDQDPGEIDLGELSEEEKELIMLVRERRLIEFMRERGINWVMLISLILQILELIQDARS